MLRKLLQILALSMSIVLLIPAGSVWATTSVTSPTTSALRGITFANGLFVAVGDKGAIITSPDGQNWIQESSGTTDDLYAITWGDGIFVAGGNDVILTSLDGKSWTTQKVIINRYNGWNPLIYGLAYGNGKFVAVGNGEWVSSDGTDWQPDGNWVSYTLHAIAYGSGIFAAVGEGGIIITSTDGVNWSDNLDSSSGMFLWSIAYGNGHFISLGAKGTIILSQDGINWTILTGGGGGLGPIPVLTVTSIPVATYNKGILFVISNTQYGDNYLPSIAFSDNNGITWGHQNINTSYALNALALGNSSLVAVGDNGTIVEINPSTLNMNNSQVTTVAKYGAHFKVGSLYIQNDSGRSFSSMYQKMDVAPYIDSSGRMMVSVSALANVLGITTQWDAATQAVTLRRGGTTEIMVIGSPTLTVNGQPQTMDTVPVIVSGRTMLPARYVAQAFGSSVTWYPNTQTVVVSLPSNQTTQTGQSSTLTTDGASQNGSLNENGTGIRMFGR